MIHILESGFENHSKHLSDDVYSQVLDSVVVACVDCAGVCGSKIFLGKRTDRPAKNQWWVQGGRMQVGVDPRRTVLGILQREVALDITDLNSIIDLNLAISYIWEDRHQPPAGHGCHMVGMYYMTIVNQTVKERLKHMEPNRNFCAFQWMDLGILIESANFNSGIRALAERILEVS